MFLVHTTSLELQEFHGVDVPPYAILSHTWGKDEVSFAQFQGEGREGLAGYGKIKASCAIAAEQHLKWMWIDTCCIDKKSSAELSEAINSMYKWYRDARVCYAYLVDVSLPPSKDAGNGLDEIPGLEAAFIASRWFRRGWTLQELLAPKVVVFYDQAWKSIGARHELQSSVTKATGISEVQFDHALSASIAQKFSWASRRQTQRIEDMAYCLLGLFNVSMPLLYGEGDRAFRRLQEEILKVTYDESIFAWEPPVPNACGLLAAGPAAFANSANIVSSHHPGYSQQPHSLTSLGLSMELHFVDKAHLKKEAPRLSATRLVAAILDCTDERDDSRVMIWLDLLPKLGGPAADISERRRAYRTACYSFDTLKPEKDIIGPITSEFVYIDKTYDRITPRHTRLEQPTSLVLRGPPLVPGPNALRFVKAKSDPTFISHTDETLTFNLTSSTEPIFSTPSSIQPQKHTSFGGHNAGGSGSLPLLVRVCQANKLTSDPPHTLPFPTLLSRGISMPRKLYTLSRRKGANISCIEDKNISFRRAFPEWKKAPDKLGANTLSAIKKVVLELDRRSYSVHAIEETLKATVERWDGRGNRKANKPSVKQFERLYKYITRPQPPTDPNQPVILPPISSASSSSDEDEDGDQEEEEEEENDQSKLGQEPTDHIKEAEGKNKDDNEGESEARDEGQDEDEDEHTVEAEPEPEVDTSQEQTEQSEEASQEKAETSSRDGEEREQGDISTSCNELEEDFEDLPELEELPLTVFSGDENEFPQDSNEPAATIVGDRFNKFYASIEDCIDRPLRLQSSSPNPSPKPRAPNLSNISRRITRRWSPEQETFDESNISIEAGRGLSHRDTVPTGNNLGNEFSSPAHSPSILPQNSTHTLSHAADTLRSNPISSEAMVRAQGSRTQPNGNSISNITAGGSSISSKSQQLGEDSMKIDWETATSEAAKGKETLLKFESKVRRHMQSRKVPSYTPRVEIAEITTEMRKRKANAMDEEEEDAEAAAALRELRERDAQWLEDDEAAYQQRIGKVKRAMDQRQKKLDQFFWLRKKAKLAAARVEARAALEQVDERYKSYAGSYPAMDDNDDNDDEDESEEDMESVDNQGPTNPGPSGGSRQALVNGNTSHGGTS
ncbi:uncharacterized protein KY384_000011 [Bacidia gigantensis]|uniref:uncharacterized protein n=1 Tax=Bacidia gigantensis TaxID=2732470 RepID=UPI001D03B22D|nr:uncharacterized protein KY384_000011 [Bacidia gigantensis]KAG8526418.1 hypothetical protein KY384_000011 [Bacidia gigantensis]